MPRALITGGSAGLGKALAAELATRGWHVVITGRHADPLAAVARRLPGAASVTAIAGDIADPGHRAEVVAEIQRFRSLDLLVNNASTLGPTPLREFARLSAADVQRVLETNVLGPFALTAALLPALASARGIVIGISSDAAVEHYPGWGAYGASKAALDHMTLTFGVENPDIACYSIDPGDMRTDMQQAAFPGEDISDRRLPADVVPALVDLIQRRPPGGRYRAGDASAEPAATGVRSPDNAAADR